MSLTPKTNVGYGYQSGGYGLHATRLMYSTIVEKADLVSAHSHTILQAFDGVAVNKLLLQCEGMTRSTIPLC